ncbi:MAG: CYTH domain-containing protein [Clostridiales bacterium]|nr:CYTH domain-containing protein [Clostridiales bacterium]
MNEKKITKIVLTGGPCAGKTTALSRIQNSFSKLGYYVIFVPEAATELITAGISPTTLKTNMIFQKFLMKLQLEHEKLYYEAAKYVEGFDKILLVCDRGLMDSKAYMIEGDFYQALAHLYLHITEARDEYDAVFHLVTAAKGAEEFYTLSNNKARTESIDKARYLDNKLISTWTGHPHLRVIDNSTDFENKMKRLICEISSFLGEPQPYEIERKFLISYPNISILENNSNCRRIEIIQTYLKSDNEDEIRVRQRGENGHYIYYKTIKRKVTDTKRIELEERLSKDEYLTLLMDADTNKRQIRKTRYCLTFENQYFEIDIYPFWNDKAIIEIELSNENEKIVFPEWVEIIKEVTDDDNYKNASLAKIN